MSKETKILEEAYFHINNGGTFLSIEENENQIRSLKIITGHFGRETLYNVEFTVAMWNWLKEICNKLEPPKPVFFDNMDANIDVKVKDGKKIEKKPRKTKMVSRGNLAYLVDEE